MGIPLGLFRGVASLLLFALTVPLAWGTIWLVQRIAGLKAAQLPAGIAVASAAALLADGVALSWVPSFYGSDAATLLPAAAWLLWGAGLCLTAASIQGRVRRHA